MLQLELSPKLAGFNQQVAPDDRQNGVRAPLLSLLLLLLLLLVAADGAVVASRRPTG